MPPRTQANERGDGTADARRDGRPQQCDLSEGIKGLHAYIEIPEDINAVQRQDGELAVKWREATRRAFSEALFSGFIVEDFFRCCREDQNVGVYMLSRGRTIEDFA
jgi:predicted GNAT superfamily acetyltransferase